MTTNLRVSVSEMTAKDLSIEKMEIWNIWDSIEPLEESRFFSESKVIRAWLLSIPGSTKFIVSALYQESEIKGLCILGICHKKEARIFPVKYLSVLRTNKQDIDQWWPEYAQPKLKKKYKKHFEWWLSEIIKLTGVSFIETAVTPTKWLEDWSKQQKHTSLIVSNKESGGVINLDLKLEWSKSIKRKLKQTENFSEKRLGELTLLKVEKHLKVEELLRYSSWHIEKWGGTDTKSGFENPLFVKILSSIMTLDEGNYIDIYQAFSGGTCVGVQIVLKDGNWAGFYLASLKTEQSNHWNIGIWMNCRIAESLKKEGFDMYDFMAGDARYKMQLSNEKQAYGTGNWYRSKSGALLISRIFKKLKLCSNIIKPNK